MILRLLIVEDEKQICDAVAKSLYDAGYEVDTCYDGEEALEYILTGSESARHGWDGNPKRTQKEQ